MPQKRACVSMNRECRSDQARAFRQQSLYMSILLSILNLDHDPRYLISGEYEKDFTDRSCEERSTMVVEEGGSFPLPPLLVGLFLSGADVRFYSNSHTSNTVFSI